VDIQYQEESAYEVERRKKVKPSTIMGMKRLFVITAASLKVSIIIPYKKSEGRKKTLSFS